MSDYAATIAYPSGKLMPGVVTEVEINKPAGAGWVLTDSYTVDGAIVAIWDKSAVSTARAMTFLNHVLPVANQASAKDYFVPPIPTGSDDNVDISAVKVVAQTKTTSAGGTVLLTGLKNGTDSIFSASFNIEGLTDGVISDVTLTATVANLNLVDGDWIEYQITSNNADAVVGTQVKVFTIYELND